jgi:hypothetical protein
MKGISYGSMVGFSGGYLGVTYGAKFIATELLLMGGCSFGLYSTQKFMKWWASPSVQKTQ